MGLRTFLSEIRQVLTEVRLASDQWYDEQYPAETEAPSTPEKAKETDNG